MSLPTAPPPKSVYSVRPGDRGWYPFAIQVGMNELGAHLAPDGAYGDLTAGAVKAFQQKYGLFADGVAGPATQPKVVSLLGATVESARDWLARGYVRGISQAEASGMISVVNWSVAEGVDCGPVQRRVKGPPFDEAAMRNAFDVGLQLARIADEWHGRRDDFLTATYPWSQGNHERAGRCAALAHNWPAGARSVAKAGSVSSPNTTATWIPRDSSGASLVRFPDGTPVETQGEWAAFYALGGPHGEALVSRYVTDWR